MQAVPALLTNNTEEFIQQVNTFISYFKRFSIDIIDGEFANNLTLQVPHIIELLENGKLKIPSDVVFDFDLMVMDYQARINDIERIQKYVQVENVVVYIRPLAGKPLPTTNKFNIGLSITPKDNIGKLSHTYNLQELLVTQIMTINPGFQGQLLMPEELNKIEQLRTKGYKNKIFIDGGVNDATLPIIIAKKYKPDYLCMGSFLTKAPDIKQRAEYLDSILK